MSTKVQLGAAGERNVSIDLDLLLRTRLLVQASSGGGKSWLLRRLAEQLFGKVQVVIVDPEGEFATLRERFGYVLVGKGGETPADRRSAALVAHRLLELRASAVCDLYEMPPRDRHAWVKLFLDALIDAPKKLWRPLVVVVDEAHVFAPEKGAGESEASDAMIGLATRGRKRGFCAVFATQRLGKLRKDAAAELLNMLVGQTFIDVDRKRAAEALGIAPADQRAFFDQLRLLKPGKFWALGRAIATERTLVTIGPVTTTHPEPGSSKHSNEPPPAPQHVKALLPKLADLPAQAEAKVKTEAELRREISELKRQVAQKPRDSGSETTRSIVKRVEIPVVSEAKLDALARRLEKIEAVVVDARDAIIQWKRLHEQRSASLEPPVLRSTVHSTTPAPEPRQRVPVAPRPAALSSTPASANGHDQEALTGPEQRILDALAEMEAMGIEASRPQLGVWCGYTNSRSGGFSEPLGRLATAQLVSYPDRGRVLLSEEGRSKARPPEGDITPAAVQNRILGKLNGPERRILARLIELYPTPITRDDLGHQLGYTNARSGGFSEPLGRLSTLGLIDYPARGHVVARPVLFLEGRS